MKLTRLHGTGGAALGLVLALLARSPAADPDSRVGDCEACRELLVEAGDAHAGDPHDFECATCHHPHETFEQRDWKATCQGCHERAWTRSVFHRLDVEVFRDCRRCHLAHTWAADGNDCLSCHEDVHGAAGEMAAVGVNGATSFSHASHVELECSVCHDSRAKHAELVVTEWNACQNCHHGSEFSDRCARCHEPAGIGAAPVALTMAVAGSELQRGLTFDHESHRDLACTECHSGPGQRVVARSCATCHHGGEAVTGCVGCHSAPSAEAHEISVHDVSCADCHGAAPADSRDRNACLSCHVELADHQPGGDCATCHKVDP